mmetsp:Transcript_97221/g.256662  ORF Transcript_97221/g.256662 Transcript_97221/m.256662 type:complete len:632 (+) Transcript_97221:72-1967(+)
MAKRPLVPPLNVTEVEAARRSAEEEAVPDDGREIQMACDKFRVERSVSSWSDSSNLDDWKQRYTLGKELGSGQTAVVYEAFAAWPASNPLVTPRTPRGNIKSPRGNGRPNSARGRGGSEAGSNASSARPLRRRVALKRFSTAGGTMFRQELRVLRAVGVHPHVLRLLESFQGPLEDVLVLEYCGGGDVYDMYASNHGCCMLEPCVVHLIRQLLLALQHLCERGVEHRDVKPENLLLYSNSQDRDDVAGTAGRMRAPPHLKLADFGWANLPEVAEGIPPEAAVSGVGSLWYAAPEMNPSPEGTGPAAPRGDAPLGACDMWSVGVIAYLLLLGHSPFNTALREPDQEAQDAKVIRLAAEGTINTESRVWSCLPEESRDFILKLIQVEPAKRMTPLEAWGHPFIARGAGRTEGGGGGYLAKLPPLLPVADVVWRRIDQFQRLCWITFAHAVAEPELVELRAFQMFIVQQRMSSHSYLHQLAVEIAAVAQPSWFQRKTVWIDALRLAFCYLDSDSDGVLSVEDLSEHLVSEDSIQVARQWVRKWQQPPASANGNGPSPSKKGITFSGFTWALCSSHAGKHFVQGLSNGHANAHADGQAEEANHQAEAVFEGRMQATDEVCQRFLDEEFDDFGFAQ